MANDEVNEHGHFWLAGTPIDEGRRFPASAVDGKLTIDENGMITLRRWNPPNNPNQFEIKKQNDVVIGYLPRGDKFVYLTQIERFYAFLPINARFCLICNVFLQNLPKIDDKTTIDIALDGFENWLGVPSPRCESRDDGTGALISTPSQNWDYELSSVGCGIEIETNWMADLLRGKGTMTASGKILLKPRAAKTLSELADTVLKLEELLLLLTNRHRCLAWPRIKLQEDEFTFYHHSRSYRGRSEIEDYASWVPLPSVATEFGQILDAWFGQSGSLISCCQFYVATRRGPRLYLEHQFASLVWALEAMSRGKSEITENKNLLEKINRILCHVKQETSLTSDDRRWLKLILDRAKEPPLKDRLFDLLKSLRLDFNQSDLQKFSESCADLRNELSHYAGSKSDKPAVGTPKKFTQDLIKLTPALDLLCHAKILQIIGVPDILIRNCFISRSDNRHYMQQAGMPLPEPPEHQQDIPISGPPHSRS